MSCLHEPAIQRQQRLAVENNPGRGSGAGWPRGELGIVGQHCSDPHQDRVHPAPELVDEGAGTGRGDPLAVTRSDSGLAVKGHRPLGRDIGEAGGNALQVRRIELGRRASLEPEIDRNPGRTEDRQAATVHAGKRITDCGDDFRNPGLEDRVGTGRRFAVVAARFERHVEGCAPGLGGILMLELHCPNFQLAHLLVWHTAVVPVSAALAVLLTKLVQVRRAHADAR